MKQPTTNGLLGVEPILTKWSLGLLTPKFPKEFEPTGIRSQPFEWAFFSPTIFWGYPKIPSPSSPPWLGRWIFWDSVSNCWRFFAWPPSWWLHPGDFQRIWTFFGGWGRRSWGFLHRELDELDVFWSVLAPLGAQNMWHYVVGHHWDITKKGPVHQCFFGLHRFTTL